MKLPKLISNGVAAKYQPESGETLEEAPEEEEEDVINKDESNGININGEEEGEDGTDADDEAEVTDIRKDDTDMNHENNEKESKAEDEKEKAKEAESPVEPKMATNCNQRMSDLEMSNVHSQNDTGAKEVHVNGDAEEHHLEGKNLEINLAIVTISLFSSSCRCCVSLWLQIVRETR